MQLVPTVKTKPREGGKLIKGTVTADQGEVHGFRVAAPNLDRGLWYTVFTVKGQHTVPQAQPDRYEVLVYEPDYDSPKSPVQLGRAESKTVDLAVKKTMRAERVSTEQYGYLPQDGDELGEGGNRQSAGKIEHVNSLDEVFPPGPGLDLLKENCTGCHADTNNSWGHMHYTKTGFLRSIERMTETAIVADGYDGKCFDGPNEARRSC